jgi:hypothetical protein
MPKARWVRTFSLWLPIAILMTPNLLASNQELRITTLSSRADKVSGGDVLVRIAGPENAPMEQVAVRLNGQDVTAMFRPSLGERALIGLVTGLRVGPNRMEALMRGESAWAPQALTIVNHPIIGPVFSGPHEQPFFCATEEFRLPDGTTLGPPLDAACSANTVVHYVYKPAGAAESGVKKPILKPLPGRTALPDDVAWTTTSIGQRVPYVVRVETGTINRSIYQTAILHDPTAEPEPSPFAAPKGWNRRLIYSFGGGCPGGWYKQGSTLGTGGGIIDDTTLGRGYAEAAATLNLFGNNCSDVIAAETMMMVKERFIEAYGAPLFTMGRGGSGGSYQQNQIADNYPGLLDGILPSLMLPDVLATTQMTVDFQLLHNYFTQRPDALTAEQQRAITGAGAFQSVVKGAPSAGRINATAFCPPQMPVPLRYDPLKNPGGARCDVFDHTVNVYGRDPETGFARRPIDNTGVQYGLLALNKGIINVTQFLDLNERIGGYDNDGNLVPTRASADRMALRAAYRTGRLTYGGGGLANIPIIDIREYRDLAPAGDLHLKYHSFALRERLRKANGTAANGVILVSGTDWPLAPFAIAKMDEWLTNLANDTSSGRTLDRIVRAKPDDLTDSCYKNGGERIVEPQVFGAGQCSIAFPDFPSSRMVAGGPVAGDILKCSLKPVDFGDYAVTLTGSEQERLRSIFPEGVCDWTKPGIEQQPLAGSWLSF